MCYMAPPPRPRTAIEVLWVAFLCYMGPEGEQGYTLLAKAIQGATGLLLRSTKEMLYLLGGQLELAQFAFPYEVTATTALPHHGARYRVLSDGRMFYRWDLHVPAPLTPAIVHDLGGLGVMTAELLHIHIVMMLVPIWHSLPGLLTRVIQRVQVKVQVTRILPNGHHLRPVIYTDIHPDGAFMDGDAYRRQLDLMATRRQARAHAAGSPPASEQQPAAVPAPTADQTPIDVPMPEHVTTPPTPTGAVYDSPTAVTAGGGVHAATETTLTTGGSVFVDSQVLGSARPDRSGTSDSGRLVESRNPARTSGSEAILTDLSHFSKSFLQKNTESLFHFCLGARRFILL